MFFASPCQSADSPDAPTVPSRGSLAAVIMMLTTTVSSLSVFAAPDRHSPAVKRTPIVTRQQTFTIPFTVNAGQLTGPLREVQLYVSIDRGQTWQLYQRQPPSAGNFSFRASRDGNYLFAVRTIGDAPTDPSARPDPELEVIIDTAMPELEFDAQLGTSGEIVARWSVKDQRLDVDAVELQFRNGEAAWQPVSVRPNQQQAPSEREVSGTASWWVEDATSEVVDVRIEVTDSAGNTRQAVERVFLVKRLPHAAPPLASSAPSRRHLGTTPSRQRGAESEWEPPFIPSSAAEPRDPYVAQSEAIDSRQESTSHQPDQVAEQWRPIGGTVADGPTARNAPVATDHGGWQAPGAVVAERDRHPTPSHRPSGAPSLHPPLQDNFSRQDFVSTMGVSNSRPSMSHDVDERPRPSHTSGRVRTASSRRFNLEYDLQHLGAAQISRVSLWHTADDGATWKLYGNDEDRTSPFAVEVGTEGIHGFCLVVHTSDGRSGAVPSAGDKPDVMILADWTRPTAEIVSATYGEGAASGTLSIKWHATDAGLGERPILLQFAPHPAGPWSTIVATENTGEYAWKLSSQIPDDIYLRLVATDRAGNRGIAQPDAPVRTAPLRPNARILSVQPSDQFPRP